MKNKAIIILIIVVAGLLAALYLMGYLPFGNEPDELNNEFSIKSNDESAELFIPKGALPDNVDRNDISITKVSNSLTENRTWVVYSLEPDGLVFAEEVLFNVTLESVNDALPLVFISNDAGIELVNNTYTEVYSENHTQRVSIPLTHFSDIWIGPDTGTMSLKLSAPDVHLGEKVNTVASFTFIKNKLKFDETDTGRGIWVYQFLDPYVFYEGTWISVNLTSSHFTPDGLFGGLPGSTKVGFKQTNTVQDDTFKADEIGRGDLLYMAEVTANVKLTYYNSESDYVDGKIESSAIYPKQKYVVIANVWINVYETRLIVQGIYTTQHENNPEIHMVVEIHGPANAAGFVTLTGRYMEPMIQPVLIGPGGSTRNTFIHPFSGEITVFVEVGEHNATRKRDFG
jgi:hypothetical protein